MPLPSRRRALTSLLACGLTSWADEKPGRPLPVTGDAGKGLDRLDEVMLGTLREHHIPGAALAIATEGRLVLARGYGFADLERRLPVQPTSIFNLASCTKAFTGAAVLRLVEQGKLGLDDRFLDAAGGVRPAGGERVDPRLRDVTVRQLLHHAGGLPRGVNEAQVAKRLRVAQPVNLHQVAAFVAGRPLDYDPGTKSVYSNLGFILLRLVVPHAAGVKSYEAFTARQVLAPMGITAMRIDLEGGYAPGEVGRYVAGKRVRAGHTLHGGGCWLASAVDAVKFLTSLDGTRGKPVLSGKMIEEMLAPLPTLPKRPNGSHTGLGWDVVRAAPKGTLYHKNGGVAGISTYMEHLPSGVNWAVLFNGSTGGHPTLSEAGDPTEDGGHKDARGAIRAAIQKASDWPEVDLFTKY
ncbi:MAG: serine hydrolase domain-containing protein [Gemmataceae bacterium]